MTPEHERAKAWRHAMGWTMDDLSELTGYSKSSIMWMERGQVAPAAGTYKPRTVSQYAWQRYKRVCHSVMVEHRRGKTFDWGV